MTIAGQPFVPLNATVLTISETRTPENDPPGDLVVERLHAAGHKVVRRAVVPDDANLIRGQFNVWIADQQIDVIISTGGTGITRRDVTPEAIEPLITKPIPGFGELFRSLSYGEIGSAAIESRALAGVAWNTLAFALPGTVHACRLAMDKLVLPQLNAQFTPYNLVTTLGRGRSE